MNRATILISANRFRIGLSSLVSIVILLSYLSVPALEAQTRKKKKAVEHILTPEMRKQIEEIFQGWKNRSKQIKTFKGIIDVTKTTPKGMRTDDITGLPLNPPQPPKDTVYNHKLLFALDFSKQRVRFDLLRRFYAPKTGKIGEIKELKTFDGKDGYFLDQGISDQDQAQKERYGDCDLAIFRDQKKSPDGYTGTIVNDGFYIALMNFGFIPKCGKLPSLILPSYNVDEYRIIGETDWNNHHVIILRYYFSKDQIFDSNYEEFWVDPALQYLVLRYQITVLTKLRLDTQFLSLNGSSSPPIVKQWRADYYLGDNKLYIAQSDVYSINEEEMNVPIPSDQFKIDPQPGMLVKDVPPEYFHTNPGTNPDDNLCTYYKIDEKGEWLHADKEGNILAKQGSYFWYYLGIGIAGTCALIFWLRKRF